MQPLRRYLAVNDIYLKGDHAMASESITFTNTAGVELAGRLDTPDGHVRSTAIVAHCFTCSKNSKAASTIARSLCDAGFAVLRFDFTGLGSSEGAFEDSGFASNVADVVAAADYLRSTRMAPSLLVGHSLGGTAVLLAADRVEECRSVVTIGAPAHPSHVTRLFVDRLDEIRDSGRATVSIGGRDFTIDRAFVDELESAPVAETLANWRRALLVFHSPVDNVVGVENAAHIFDAARHPKSFVSLDSADHLLTDPEDGRYVAAVTAAWVRRYIPRESDVDTGVSDIDMRADNPDVAAGTALVTIDDPGSFTSTVRTRHHRFIADEPPDVGGADLGPSPYELLSAALGTCTAMTLQMYAARKGIPLDRVDVVTGHERVHSDDCDDCESKNSSINVMRRSIRLSGVLNEDQRTALMRIADRCPVHRTLESDIEIITSEDANSAS